MSHRSTGVHLHSVMNWAVTSVWECCGAILSHSVRLIAQWRCGVWMGAAGMAPSEANRPQGQKGRVGLCLGYIWTAGCPLSAGVRARLSWKSSCHFCCCEMPVSLPQAPTSESTELFKTRENYSSSVFCLAAVIRLAVLGEMFHSKPIVTVTANHNQMFFSPKPYQCQHSAVTTYKSVSGHMRTCLRANKSYKLSTKT